jgi:predicted nucleic acid-binding Zn ribbon protein
MSDAPRARRRPVPEEEAEILVAAPSGYPVGPAIQEFLEKGGLSKIAQFGLIADAWNEVVGEDVAGHCRPRRLDGEDLVVEVDHRGWITELSFRQEAILRGLEERLGRAIARRLKVTLGG